MLRPFLFSLFLAPALAAQVPFKLGSNLRWKGENLEGVLSDGDRTEWNINKLPNPNDTDDLVFETVYSLLQHWPNTRMRNGHNIVPGIIPKGTLLYRGSRDDKLPPGPDWVSIDPEHAYIFCRSDLPPPGSGGNFAQQGCWHLTLVAARPLKILYFDGNSAAELPYGSLDTQDLLAWGKANFDSLPSDRQRIDELCKWGKKFDVDAFVRMEMDFEVMLCDFSSGVSVASLANLVDRWDTPSLSSSTRFEVLNSGSWHNRFPGETRVQLDLSGLVSFYDTKLVPSLVAVRAGQERWDHRTGNVSSEDLAAVKSRLEANLVRPSSLSSGFDWRTHFQIIVDRFAGRLELTRHLLNSSAVDADEIFDLANKTHTQLRIMLTPYILLSARPTDPSDKTDLVWTIPIYQFCATIHTKFIESELESMTDSERLLLQAVQGTSQEICRVLTKMWAAGVYAGIDQSLNTKDPLDIAEITQVWSKWAKDLNQLMTWLDWSVWVKCNPDCAPEEICYLPTWPVGFPDFAPRPSNPERLPHPERPSSFGLRDMVMERFAEDMRNPIKSELDSDWVRPQPRCIPRIAPYETDSLADEL